MGVNYIDKITEDTTSYIAFVNRIVPEYRFIVLCKTTFRLKFLKVYSPLPAKTK